MSRTTKISDDLEPFLRLQLHKDEERAKSDAEMRRIYERLEKNADDNAKANREIHQKVDSTHKEIATTLSQLAMSIAEQTATSEKQGERLMEAVRVINANHLEMKERSEKLEAQTKDFYLELRTTIQEEQKEVIRLDKEVSALMKTNKNLGVIGMALLLSLITGLTAQFFQSYKTLEELRIQSKAYKELQAKK